MITPGLTISPQAARQAVNQSGRAAACQRAAQSGLCSVPSTSALPDCEESELINTIWSSEEFPPLTPPPEQSQSPTGEHNTQSAASADNSVTAMQVPSITSPFP